MPNARRRMRSQSVTEQQMSPTRPSVSMRQRRNPGRCNRNVKTRVRIDGHQSVLFFDGGSFVGPLGLSWSMELWSFQLPDALIVVHVSQRSREGPFRLRLQPPLVTTQKCEHRHRRDDHCREEGDSRWSQQTGDLVSDQVSTETVNRCPGNAACGVCRQETAPVHAVDAGRNTIRPPYRRKRY